MDRGDDARLVERVRGGDPAAFAPLFERWYDRVYDVARGVVRRPELAADVAQETFIAAWQQLDRLENVESFGGWLLRIARYKALDAIRRESRARPTGVETVSAMQDRGVPEPAGVSRRAGPVDLVEANEDHALVWAAAAALGERDASVLDLHLRHGLTPAEVAEDLGVTPNHAHQLMHRMRSRLEDAVGSFLLWRDGVRSCEGLRSVAAPVFDARAAASVRKHERSCPTCQEERRRRTSPVALFSATPVVAAPLLFRARAAEALAAHGVPVRPELVELAGTEPFGGGATGDAGPRGCDVTEGGASGSGGFAEIDDESGSGASVSEAKPLPSSSALASVQYGSERPGAGRRRQRLAAGAASAAVVAVVAMVVIVLGGDGSGTSDSVGGGDGVVAAGSVSPSPIEPAADWSSTTTTSTTITSTTTTSPTSPAATIAVVAPTTAELAPVSGPPDTEPVDAAVPGGDGTSPDPTTTAPVATQPPTTSAPPTTAPPTTPPPTTAPPTTPPSTTQPPTVPPRPIIWSFTIERSGHRCQLSLDQPSVATWSTEGASSVTLSSPGGSQGVAESGSQQLCLPPGTAVTLTASSTAGDAVSTVTAP